MFLQLCWVVTMIASAIGGILALLGLLSPGASAPQQGAMAAMGAAFAVVPYVFTRAIEGMRRLPS